MFEQIQEILADQVEAGKIQDWVVQGKKNDSVELFFVKDQLDMNREALTTEYSIKVYVDQEEGGKKVRGQASCQVGPDDSKEEILAKVNQAALQASFIKNPYFPLPKNDPDQAYQAPKAIPIIQDFKDRYEDCLQAFFAPYKGEARINSLEIFAVEAEVRVLTSMGADYSYPSQDFSFELVTEADGEEDPVEVFRDYHLGSLDLDKVRAIVEAQLEETAGRAQAKPAKAQKGVRVIITGADVEDLCKIPLGRCTAGAIYQKVSNEKKGQALGAQVAGATEPLETWSLSVQPDLDEVPFARPVDGVGKVLEAYPLVEDGKVVNFTGSCDMTYYLGEDYRGNCSTFTVAPGKESLEAYKKGDYIEILKFSSFIFDPVTGDFGGEFRLARQVQDGKAKYITGGAIAENFFKAQNRIHLSKELASHDYSTTPKAVIIDGVEVTGEK